MAKTYCFNENQWQQVMESVIPSTYWTKRHPFLSSRNIGEINSIRHWHGKTMFFCVTVLSFAS
jgi:hypothetical protein